MQGFALVRQASYHLSHTSSFFALVILETGAYFLLKLAWTAIFLFVLPHGAGMTNAHHHAQPLVEMGVS
jgi:hypothetical protein